MAIDFSEMVYKPNYETFARSVTFFPDVSQPSLPQYDNRGIFNDRHAIDVPAVDGSLISDTVTILDILDEDFDVLPVQNDRVNIPASGSIPAAGMFLIKDTSINGGGETTLYLQKIVTADPP